jgi:uncharacterized SAM-binding protein YcdF (DUF218 family)/lysophospholipase L1-like esterase
MTMPETPAPAAPPAPGRHRKPPRRLVWFVFGALSLIAARELTNRLAWPDAVVGPLLLQDTSGAADVIVVPGAGLSAACTPNLNSVRRTLLAARLYKAGRAPFLLFSGGRPRAGDLACRVGRVMANLAIEVGVPADAVRVEDESRTTHMNAEFSAPILRQMGARRILIVTDRLHMVRAAAAYAHYGFAIERASIPVFEGHRDNVDMLAGGLREFVAIRYYRWKGWIEDPWAPATAPAAARTQSAAGTKPGMMSLAAAGASAAPVRPLPASLSTPASTTMTQPSVPAHPQGPIVLLGASYAGGWKAATLGGVPVVNKGIAGQQSFELLARFDSDVLPARPRAVVIWGFANDVFRAPRAQVDAAMAKMQASVSTMIAKARAAGIEPILATEVTIREPNTWSDWFAGWAGWALGKTSYQEYVNGHILRQNRWIRETAAREGLLLLDLQPVVGDPSGPRRAAFAQDDGSHISEAGYAALSAYADAALAAHFRQP